MISRWRGFALLSIFFFTLAARAEFRVPALTGPVVDEAGLLSQDTSAALDQALRRLRSEHGTQLNVLTVSSLEGLPIEQASIQVTDQWKLGTAKEDKGVLLMIAPKEHKLRIEVGQGLEGVLTDADSKRIVSDTISPLFKQRQFDEGVLQGVVEIVRRTNPEVDPRELFQNLNVSNGSDVIDVGLGKLIKWFLILMFFLFIIRPRRRRSGFANGFLWGAATGWGSRGWGSGGGGWGGGGGGGGGWGGGGGGFSGGGASGDW